jgi:hypothetical protein
MDGSRSTAIRHYVRRFWPTMLVYVLTILAVTWIFKQYHPHGFLMYLLAVLPALPILGIIAIFGLYISEEQDEFVRTVMMQSSLWATGIVLAFATFWGFLEDYTPVGKLPMYWVFVAWCVVFGLVQPLVRRRYR